MNRVEFLTSENGPLEIKVDGILLQEHLRRAELPSARADGQADLAGSYAGLTRLDLIRWPSRHFLGSPALTTTGDDTVLLGCDCGDWGCWPLSANVHLTPTTVTWTDFTNEHRPNWDRSTLRPFTFQRPQYESALRATELT
ncbi:hypothetical protein GCM10009853_093850 [Glycomyces scopariae]